MVKALRIIVSIILLVISFIIIIANFNGGWVIICELEGTAGQYGGGGGGGGG